MVNKSAVGSDEIAAPPGEDNDAQLFAQSRTLRIRQANGLNLSIADSTSSLRAVAILSLSDFHKLCIFSSPPATLARCSTVNRGTRARIEVPQPGFELMENSPPINFSLSRMLMSPRPRRSMASR